jgi:hypothetical protein
MSNWPTMSVDEANNILTASGMQGEVIEIEICGVLKMHLQRFAQL